MSGQVATERDGAGRLPKIHASRFVARAGELAALTSALAGPPAVVLVEGEAGIGKTRLVGEFMATRAGRAQRALVACCPPLRIPQTLAPVADALRQAAGDVRGLRLSPLAGALRPLFPEWAAGLPPAPEPAEDVTAIRHRLFRALAELAECLGVAVLVLEDAHWADEATLEFLLYLASGQPWPVSLVVTCRPEDVPEGSLLRRLSRLASGANGLRLTLGPLDVTDTAGLVSSMLAGVHASAEFTALLHDRTDGVPLAVEESVRLMADRADLIRHDGRWARRHLDEIPVPPTVRDAVLERAARLSQDAQTVLRAAGVLADPVSDEILTTVAGVRAGSANSGLCEALGSSLLAQNRRGLVSFRHALACQAVYEAIPAPQRRSMHLRAGRALERLPSPPVAQLARHFREAGEAAEWCKYAEQAADLALSSGDETIAIAHLHALVAGADLPAGSLVRLMDKIPFTSFTGPAQFRELVVAIRSVLSSKLLEPEEEAAVRFHLGRLLLQMEEWSEGRAELERAIPHLAHEPIYAARAMILLGWPRGTTCPVSVHLRWLRRAARLAAPTARADRLPFAVDRASALLMLGNDAGWADAPRILDDAADDAASRRHIARGHLNMGNSAMTWGRYDEARNRLAKASDLAVTHHYARLHAEILLTQVHLDWFTGAWDGIAERAGSLAGNDDAQPVMRLGAALVVGLLHAATGAAAEAEERLEVVLAETLRLGELEHSMQSAAALSRLRLASGRRGDALQASDAPIGILVSKGIWLWATDLAPARVAALAAAGRAGEASELVAAFARGLRGRNAPAPRAGLMTCRAILAEAGGEHARAAASFARAAAAWQALPRPYDALLARERQACCLLAAGRPGTALPLLCELRAELITLGALGDADRVVRTLRKHGIAAKGPQRGGKRGLGDQLSPRELEVVRLLTLGQTDREIAEALVVSPKTVAYHLDSARRKLKAQSRTALAVTALAAGLVSGQPPAPGNQPAGTGAKTGNSPSS